MCGRKFQNKVKNCTPSEGLGGGFPTPSLLNNMTKKRHSAFREIEKTSGKNKQDDRVRNAQHAHAAVMALS